MHARDYFPLQGKQAFTISVVHDSRFRRYKRFSISMREVISPSFCVTQKAKICKKIFKYQYCAISLISTVYNKTLSDKIILFNPF